jgi:ankyrin repeat protein
MLAISCFHPMHEFRPEATFPSLIGAFALFAATAISLEPQAHTPLSGDDLVRAVVNGRASLIDLCFRDQVDPNARGPQERTPILIAALQGDWSTVKRLIDAGAPVDLADENGLTPLMASAMAGKVDVVRALLRRLPRVEAIEREGRSALHFALAAKEFETAEALLPFMPNLGKAGANGGDLLALALDTGNEKIIGDILQRLPPLPAWSNGAYRALEAALAAGRKDEIRLLLGKHTAPPAPQGKSVPLLAYAVARNDAALFNTLLSCGADPNTILPAKCDKDFLALLPPKSIRGCVEDDKNVTVLMLASGLGQAEYVRALLAAGADKNRATGRYKMLALYFAAQTGKWRCTQILLGSGLPPEQLRIEIYLASQHVALIKDGVPIFNSICSTGRAGYSTRSGDYVITDKERSHRSTIYKVEMPYFMRLSCLDFGMHEGVVPNYPASHGCIRLPGETARRLFSEIPVGTLVSVK